MPTTSHTRSAPRLLRLALLLTTSALALPAKAATLYLLTQDGKLASTFTANPAANTPPVTITGVTAGETLVAIDVRPQNQKLYALGVNATADTATLYHVAPETGVAAVVGTASSVAFTTDGTTVVDLPDPATVSWDIDFNPAVDRIRVVAGSLSFRINPNTGAPVDGDNGGSVTTGTNPDGAISGGTTTVNAAAYTNNQPNNGSITTLYTLDPVSNSLFIQNPPNAGTQSLGQTVTLGGATLDFSKPTLDIAPGVNAPASNTAVAAGSASMVATVAGATSLYSLNLVNGQATLVGAIGLTVRSAALRTELVPAIALSADGLSLIRFDTSTPGTVTTVASSGITSGETLVGIDGRPQTGQLYGLGVNATANTATLYLIDPQNGVGTAVGAASSIAFVTAVAAAVDLPDPAIVGYGMDFNPTVDRIRVVTGGGLNFRVNPNTGAPVDGDLGGAAGSTAGTNTDAAVNGASITGLEATAYTNSFGQSLTGGVTTQYTVSAATNQLAIQNPPNAGTQTLALPITLGTAALDIGAQTGFDISSEVKVASSGAAATGSGWIVTTVSGVAGVYRLDLRTGKATTLGNLGAGTTSASGLVVWSSLPTLGLTSDAVTSIPGVPTRITPLANDSLSGSAVITGVSDAGITISGRTLIVPAGFTGTFTYNVTDGATSSQGSVTVTAGTAVTSPTTFQGLVTEVGGDIVGSANVTISTTGIATVQLRGGTSLVNTKVIFSPASATTASTFTTLGNLTLVRNANGTVSLTLAALGGNIGGTLRAVRSTATAEKHHIALASIDSAIPGGGYAIALVSTKGAVAITGLLPDGLPFSATSALRDNGSIAFYTVVAKGPKPPAVLGGELLTANLATTDVTGELAYVKLPQVAGTKGLHLGGIDTTLTANGSKFTGLAPLLTGNGTLKLSGGNLAATESNGVAISAAGIPAVPTGALKTWTGVTAKLGKFTATVAVPAVAKPVKGSGLYLPKSNRAWGFFPGTTVGGRIELTVP